MVWSSAFSQTIQIQEINGLVGSSETRVFFLSHFGGRNRGISVEATALIDQMHRLHPGITTFSWHDREE